METNGLLERYKKLHLELIQVELLRGAIRGEMKILFNHFNENNLWKKLEWEMRFSQQKNQTEETQEINKSGVSPSEELPSTQQASGNALK